MLNMAATLFFEPSATPHLLSEITSAAGGLKHAGRFDTGQTLWVLHPFIFPGQQSDV